MRGGYYERRRRKLEKRGVLVEAFLRGLASRLPHATIVVVGGRAREGLGVGGPRDLDVLVVVEDPTRSPQVEEAVRELRPRELPVDLLVLSLEELEGNCVVARALEEGFVLVSDGLGVGGLLEELVELCRTWRKSSGGEKPWGSRRG